MRTTLTLLLALVLLAPTTSTDATAFPVAHDESSTTQRTRDLHLVTRYDDLPDPICRKKRRAYGEPGPCERVLTLRTSTRYQPPNPARQRTVEDNLRWCKDLSAVARGLYYVNWKEEVKGTYCWIEGPRFPEITKNSWQCGYSSAIGYDVHVEDCWDARRTGDTTAGWWISVYDRWKVSAAFRGFPMHWTFQMHVNLHPTGTIALKNDD